MSLAALCKAHELGYEAELAVDRVLARLNSTVPPSLALSLVRIKAFGREVSGKHWSALCCATDGRNQLARGVAEGVLTRWDDQHDRRRIWINLTPEGRKLVADLETALAGEACAR